MFDRQQADFGRLAAVKKLRAISVAFPTHAAEQRAIAQPESNQIAPAAMIRSEHQLARREFRKRLFDVDGPKTRAVAADDDHLVVAHLVGFLDGVLQTCGEVVPGLAVDSRSIRD